MKCNNYVLAIDLGTTNCKTLLIDHQLKVHKKISIEYPVSIPQPGWSEQNPGDWWDIVKKTIKHVTKEFSAEAIKAIGISGQMHGLVTLDKNNQPIRPAILWNDQRSAPQCQQIYQAVGGKEGLLNFTNNPMLPGYTGGKILWLRDNEPNLYEQISHILLPKDYIGHKLTGNISTDVSDASGTGLFDVRQRTWAYDLIKTLGLPIEWFPQVYESTEIIGEISKEISTETGLAVGTPVIAGGGDAVMQTVGSGATTGNVALVVIGTGGNVTVSTKHVIENPGSKLQVFCHVIPNQWVAMGVIISAGSSLKWFRDNLATAEVQLANDLGKDPYEIIIDIAEKSHPGSNGLIFLPYLQGERCPYTNPHASGAFVGLKANTRKSHVIRAIMEGVTFALRDVLEVFISLDIKPNLIHTSGGGSASPLWRQMQADIFGREVTMLEFGTDASALGAGILAGTVAAFWSSVEEAESLIPKRYTEKPIAENSKKYQQQFNIYQAIYSRLEPIYEQLAELEQ
jgi:xylulokinase